MQSVEGLSPVLNANFGFKDYAFLLYFFLMHRLESKPEAYMSLELGYVWKGCLGPVGI